MWWGLFIGSEREVDEREQLRWKVRGCLVVGGFWESRRRLAEEKGRSMKGSYCRGRWRCNGEGNKMEAEGLVLFFQVRGEAGKGKGRLCGDSEKEEGADVGGERPVFCLATWGRSTGLKEMGF